MEAPIIPMLAAINERAGDIGRMLPIALEPWFLIGFKEYRERWIDLGEREYLRRLMHRTNRSSGAVSRISTFPDHEGPTVVRARVPGPRSPREPWPAPPFRASSCRMRTGCR